MTTVDPELDMQKIYLSRVTGHLTFAQAGGPTGSPDPLVDNADINPGFFVFSPSSYDQVFMRTPLPDGRLRSPPLSLRSCWSWSPQPRPHDFAKRTAT